MCPRGTAPLGRLLVGGREFFRLRKITCRLLSATTVIRPWRPASAVSIRSRRAPAPIVSRPWRSAAPVTFRPWWASTAVPIRSRRSAASVTVRSWRASASGASPVATALSATAAFFEYELACLDPLGLVQDAVAVLVKLGEQLNSLATATASSSSAPAAAPARWRGRAPFRPGLIAGALPTAECIAGGLAFLLVEFAVLVFVEPLEDLLPECLTVGAFPATWRPLCRLRGTPLGQARLRSQASGIIELLSAESC